jgi:adenylosuccinate synthase
MSALVVVGAQWGDEGKGKLVDVLAERADYVVRYQGGANAGHTLVVKDQKIVLHLIPSGILRPDSTCVIGPGTVIDPEALWEEVQTLKSLGLLTQERQLQLSDQATLVFPFHKALDQAREKQLGDKKIGTTGRGIGPAYEDRAGRRAILLRDLFEAHSVLEEKIHQALQEKNILLKHYKEPLFEVKAMLQWALGWKEKLAPYRGGDVGVQLSRSLKAGKRVLFEGAQGSLLDVFHGTYPFVTSSSTIAAGALTSLGLGAHHISGVIGVMKAYATRVGSGPFPSELFDETGKLLQEKGHEFGSTTGRARRCGWLDLVALKYAIRLNGITNLAMMKLDVLSHVDKIGVCVAYEIGGRQVTETPTSLAEWEQAKPVIEYLPGWKEDLSKAMSLKDLPRHATNYIDFVSKQLGTPIDVISVGPGREQTLWVKPLFAN